LDISTDHMIGAQGGSMPETTGEPDGANYLTAPAAYEETPPLRRNGNRGLLPSTWLGRSVRIAYTDAHGLGVETSGSLLDWCPVGAVFNLAGARCIVPWDRLALLELIND
jgi:hypothetical protein